MTSTPRAALIRTDHTTPRQMLRGTVTVRRGVRVEPAEWQGLKPHVRYAERVRAAAMALDDPLFAFESAAVLHGLPIFNEPRDVHVFVTGAGHSHRFGDVLAHTGADGRPEQRIAGARATSLVATVIDLVRVLPLALGVAIVDDALRKGASMTDLEGLLRVQRNPRGRARAWDALRRADPRSESVLESVSRVVIELLGFEPPELQVEFVVAGRVRRADFVWRSVGVVGEADGNAKYLEVSPAETSERLRDERRREVELQLVVARVVRWEWADVMAPARLEAILVAGGVPRGRVADPRVVAAVDNGARTVRQRRR